MKVFLIILGLICAAVIFVLIDEGAGKDLPRNGTVVGRSFSPESTTYTSNLNGTITPITTSESYSLRVLTAEGIAEVPVQPYYYMNTPDGTHIAFADKIGFFTGVRYKK